MNYLYIKIIIVFTVFGNNSLLAKGFAAGTLVKTPNGYTKIENIQVGDYVNCFNEDKVLVECPVKYIAKQLFSFCIRCSIGNEIVYVAPEQRFYSINDDKWIAVSSLFDRCKLLTARGDIA